MAMFWRFQKSHGATPHGFFYPFDVRIFHELSPARLGIPCDFGSPLICPVVSHCIHSYHGRTPIFYPYFFPLNQWPFQEPKLEIPTIHKAYVRPMVQGMYPQNMPKHMVPGPSIWRILEFPLNKIQPMSIPIISKLIYP